MSNNSSILSHIKAFKTRRNFEEVNPSTQAIKNITLKKHGGQILQPLRKAPPLLQPLESGHRGNGEADIQEKKAVADLKGDVSTIITSLLDSSIEKTLKHESDAIKAVSALEPDAREIPAEEGNEEFSKIKAEIMRQIQRSQLRQARIESSQTPAAKKEILQQSRSAAGLNAGAHLNDPASTSQEQPSESYQLTRTDMIAIQNQRESALGKRPPGRSGEGSSLPPGSRPVGRSRDRSSGRSRDRSSGRSTAGGLSQKHLAAFGGHSKEVAAAYFQSSDSQPQLAKKESLGSKLERHDQARSKISKIQSQIADDIRKCASHLELKTKEAETNNSDFKIQILTQSKSLRPSQTNGWGHSSLIKTKIQPEKKPPRLLAKLGTKPDLPRGQGLGALREGSKLRDRSDDKRTIAKTTAEEKPREVTPDSQPVEAASKNLKADKPAGEPENPSSKERYSSSIIQQETRSLLKLLKQKKSDPLELLHGAESSSSFRKGNSPKSSSEEDAPEEEFEMIKAGTDEGIDRLGMDPSQDGEGRAGDELDQLTARVEIGGQVNKGEGVMVEPKNFEELEESNEKVRVWMGSEAQEEAEQARMKTKPLGEESLPDQGVPAKQKDSVQEGQPVVNDKQQISKESRETQPAQAQFPSQQPDQSFKDRQAPHNPPASMRASLNTLRTSRSKESIALRKQQSTTSSKLVKRSLNIRTNSKESSQDSHQSNLHSSKKFFGKAQMRSSRLSSQRSGDQSLSMESKPLSTKQEIKRGDERAASKEDQLPNKSSHEKNSAAVHSQYERRKKEAKPGMNDEDSQRSDSEDESARPKNKLKYFKSINQRIISRPAPHLSSPSEQQQISQECPDNLMLAAEDLILSKTKKRDEYLVELFHFKPWLQWCVPNLKSAKLEFIQKNYPLTDEDKEELLMIQNDEERRREYEEELAFIREEVAPKRNMMREKKTDKELLMDFRFSNKYGQFLYERIKQRSHEERLGLGSGTADRKVIRKQFHQLALQWHPDNIKKKQKYCFASKTEFTSLQTQIFGLFKESYEVLMAKQ